MFSWKNKQGIYLDLTALITSFYLHQLICLLFIISRTITKTRLFKYKQICVEVLRPSQPHVYWAGLVFYCAHSFARNWQLPFLNQRKGENDHRKYFTINLHERMLPTLEGVEPVTSWSPVGRHIQLSHRGPQIYRKFHLLKLKIFR